MASTASLRIADMRTMILDDPSPRSSSVTRHAFTVAFENLAVVVLTDPLGFAQRVSPRQRRSPENVLLRAEVLWKAFGGRDARAVWSAKLRPIGACKSELNQQTDKPAHCD